MCLTATGDLKWRRRPLPTSREKTKLALGVCVTATGDLKWRRRPLPTSREKTKLALGVYVFNSNRGFKMEKAAWPDECVGVEEQVAVLLTLLTW